MKFSELRSRKTYLILAAILLLAAGIGLTIYSDRYPVAIVNGRAISARSFRSHHRAAQAYLENLRKHAPTGTPQADLGPEALEAMVLDQLIENELVRQGAEKEAGDELEYLVGNKLAQHDSDPELVSAASALYGQNYPQFREDFLKPQAERDVLAGRLYLDGEKLQDWLAAARASARVNVFSNGFRWQEGKVVGAGR